MVQPRSYNVMFNCPTTTCPGGYPTGVRNVTVDANGTGDYVTAGAFSGSCNCVLSQASCQSNCACNYNAPGGNANGLINWNGAGGSGMFSFNPNTNGSGAMCNASCTVMLQ
jgi:hypothetical protein